MRVLVVEDDMVIAGGIGPVVTEAGHDLVGLAADRDTAVALLNSTTVHLALVDLRLADGWGGVDVVRAATENGAAAVIMTANSRCLLPDLAGADGFVEKPFSDTNLKAVLEYFAIRCDGTGESSRPACLKLAAPTHRPSPPAFPENQAGAD